MTSTEIEIVPKAEIEILHGPHEATRRERREKRRKRNRLRAAGAATVVVIVGAAGMFTIISQPPGTAQATETVETTVPPPPPPPAEISVVTTTWPEPDPLPATSLPPEWEWFKVRTDTAETLGKLVTDGRHAGRDNRVVPGEIGVAVISVDATLELDKAQTVVVGGTEWLIFNRKEVDATNINPLFKTPTIPQVTLLVETTTDKRPYVEMRLK